MARQLLPDALTTLERVKNLIFGSVKLISMRVGDVSNNVITISDGNIDLADSGSVIIGQDNTIYNILSVNTKLKTINLDKNYSGNIGDVIKLDTSSNNSFNDLLIQLINNATRYIGRQTGTATFKETTYVEEEYSLRSDTQRLIFLKNVPIKSIEKLEYGSGIQSIPVWREYLIYNWNRYSTKKLERSGGIYVDFAYTNRVINFRATYVAGYKIDWANETNPDLHELPMELSQVCEELVVRKWRRRDLGDVKSLGVDKSSTTFIDGLTAEQEEIINQFQRVSNF